MSYFYIKNKEKEKVDWKEEKCGEGLNLTWGKAAHVGMQFYQGAQRLAWTEQDSGDSFLI